MNFFLRSFTLTLWTYRYLLSWMDWWMDLSWNLPWSWWQSWYNCPRSLWTLLYPNSNFCTL